jgi:hypothetical protein
MRGNITFEEWRISLYSIPYVTYLLYHIWLNSIPNQIPTCLPL